MLEAPTQRGLSLRPRSGRLVCNLRTRDTVACSHKIGGLDKFAPRVHRDRLHGLQIDEDRVRFVNHVHCTLVSEKVDCSARVLLYRRKATLGSGSGIDCVEQNILAGFCSLRQRLVPSRTRRSTWPPVRNDRTLFPGEVEFAHVHVNNFVGVDLAVSV